MKTLIVYLLTATPLDGVPSTVDTFKRSEAPRCVAIADNLNAFYTRTHIRYECVRLQVRSSE